MNFVDLIVASVMVAIIVVASFGFIEFVKYGLIDSENRYEANKFSTATLEELQPLLYEDPRLDSLVAHYGPGVDLPDGCNLKTRYDGSRTYTVTEKEWVGEPNEYNYFYKEVRVTTSWTYRGEYKSVSFGVLKRNDQTAG